MAYITGGFLLLVKRMAVVAGVAGRDGVQDEGLFADRLYRVSLCTACILLGKRDGILLSEASQKGSPGCYQMVSRTHIPMEVLRSRAA